MFILAPSWETRSETLQTFVALHAEKFSDEWEARTFAAGVWEEVWQNYTQRAKVLPSSSKSPTGK